MKDFITELIARLGKDNPAFFKKIQLVALLIGGLSAALISIDREHCLLPSWLSWLESHASWITSLATILMAQLPSTTANETSNKKNEPK